MRALTINCAARAEVRLAGAGAIQMRDGAPSCFGTSIEEINQ